MIIPTIGRKVWLWMSGADRLAYEQAIAEGIKHPEVQPLDASICYTHDDITITVTAVNRCGVVTAHESVELIQEGTPWDEQTGKHCQWMPYQVAAAAASAATSQPAATRARAKK